MFLHLGGNVFFSYVASQQNTKVAGVKVVHLFFQMSVTFCMVSKKKV